MVGYLRLSTVKHWLHRRAIGDYVGVGLRFGVSNSMEFPCYIAWKR